MQENPPGNEGSHDESPATFMTHYASYPPVLDNIVHSTNIFSGVSCPRKMP